MQKLTRYDSYEALKAGKSCNNTNEQKRAERNAALKNFVGLLRDSLKEEEQNSKPAGADERDIGQTDRSGL